MFISPSFIAASEPLIVSASLNDLELFLELLVDAHM